jgi:uncharacterized membrane protein
VPYTARLGQPTCDLGVLVDRLVSLGRFFYAIGMIAFGLEHIVFGGFVTRVVPSMPATMPGGLIVWRYAVAAILIASGLAILFRFYARAIALLLGLLIFLSVILLYVPLVAPTPTNGGLLTMMFKAVAFSGGAFAIARTFAKSNPHASGLALLWIGRLFFGSFLVLCGILHFIYRDFVATLVPQWIGNQMFWTLFAGVSLIAGGIGINVPRLSRPAALLVGLMIFSWVFLVHIPRAMAAKPGDSNELTAVFEAIAMSGIAFVLTRR